MKRILFVDDEPKVLDGLRRMLRSLRREWDMRFCESGADALSILDQEPRDVIVTDMRMPGMDGAALLTEVRRRHPQIARIVLSGQSSRESTLKSVGVAHQVLAKPCDAETLKQTIEHVLALRSLLANEALKRTLSQLVSIPSMPALYEKLTEELMRAEASTRRVGEIVSQDLGMTTKILQLVNSAFFGLPRHISNPTQATALLGIDTMKALVLTIDVFSQFEGSAIVGLSPESVQQHSLATAAAAKQIAAAEQAEREVIDAALVAGFLHDVGKLILAENLPPQYERIITCAREQHVPLCQAEREVLGTTHAEVGAYLLGLWGLPDPVVEATAFHHTPAESPTRCFSPLTAVHLANVWVSEQAHGPAVEVMDADYLSSLGLSDRLVDWREACRRTVPVSEGVA